MRNTGVRVAQKRDGSGWTFSFLTQEGQDHWEGLDEDDAADVLDRLGDFADGLLPGQADTAIVVLP